MSCERLGRGGASVSAGLPDDALDRIFQKPPGTVTVLRRPPADDGLGVALAATRCGDALIVVPGTAAADRIAAGLRRFGVRVALGIDGWETAAAGATVVGTRVAAWMPMPRLAAVVVVDEHDESLQSQSTPTWHARDVALERARRRGVPTVLMSPVPSLEALALERRSSSAPGLVSREAERLGWPVAVCARPPW